jgi:hypothetical protein
MDEVVIYLFCRNARPVKGGERMAEVEIVGFTGTQQGMNPVQAGRVIALLMELRPEVVVHGDCVGADADFDELMQSLKREGVAVRVEIRPGVDAQGKSPARAYTKTANTVHQAKPYMKRNEDIVRQCDVLIAAPAQDKMAVRSGTWATVRRALKMQKPVYVVMRNGDVELL